MIRTILVQEFKRSLYQALLVLFPILLGLIAIERFALAGRLFPNGVLGGTPDVVVDVLVTALLAISAFVFGVGGFYRLTDRHVWFVHSLPMPRLQFWTLILVANLSVIVLTTPVVFLLRPSLWTRSDSWSIGAAWPYALGVYLVLFAAGCCFSMMFRNVATITIVGGTVIGASLGITLLFSSVADARFGSVRWYGIFLSNRTNAEFWLFSSLVLSLLYLGLSLHFFTKGEFRLLRTRVKNCVLVGLLIAVYPMLNGVALETGFFGGRLGYNGSWPSVSADGRYVAVFEGNSQNEFITGIRFIDVASGSLTGTYDSYGLLPLSWSQSKPVLTVVSLQSALRRLGYLLPPSDSIIRLSPEGRVLDRVTFGFSEILNVQPQRAGNVLVLTKSGSQAKVFSIGDGSQKELLTIPMKDAAVVHAGPAENIIATYSAAPFATEGRMQLEEAWSVGADVRKLTWAIESDDRARAEFLLDGKLHSRTAALAALKQQFPYATGPLFYVFANRFRYNRGLRFLTSSDSCWGCPWSVPDIDVVSPKHVFAVSIDRNAGTSKFLKFDRPQLRWQVLGETLPFRFDLRTPSQGEGISNRQASIGGSHVIGDHLAIFYVTRGTERDAYLYDAETERRFLLFSSPLTNRSTCLVDERVGGIDGFLLRCPDSAFVYNQRDGLKNARLLKGNPLYLYKDGSQISEYLDQVFYVSAGGQERRLWPLP